MVERPEQVSRAPLGQTVEDRIASLERQLACYPPASRRLPAALVVLLAALACAFGAAFAFRMEGRLFTPPSEAPILSPTAIPSPVGFFVTRRASVAWRAA